MYTLKYFKLFLLGCSALMLTASTASAHEIVRYTLSVSTSGDGTGTIISSPKGIKCSACSKSFNRNKRVTLTAKPAKDARFAGWGGACSAFGTKTKCIIRIDEDKNVTAQFDAVTRYVLSVSGSGDGTGEIKGTPAGLDSVINCGADCLAVYLLKNLSRPKRVTLTATPALDSTFGGWEGACAAFGRKSKCTLKMDGDKNATARFDAVPRFTITVTQGGGGTGTVTGIPRGIDTTINCGAVCSATYLLKDPANPTTVTLVARPSGDSIFVGWSGQCRGTDPCIIEVNADKTVRAAFITQASTQLQADSLSIQSGLPGALLTVEGSGFDLRSNFFVRFTSGGPFSFDIPAVDVRPSSISAIVPPFIDANTGQFIPGVVNIHVVQQSEESTVISAPINGFQIEDLPSPLALPGVVTLSLLLANVDIATLEQNNVPGTLFDTGAVIAALSTQVNNFSALTANIEQLLQDSSRTFSLGSVNGNDITITSSDLVSSDRLIIGLMLALGSNPTASSPGGSLSKAVDGQAGCASEAANAFVKKALTPDADLVSLEVLAQNVYKAHSQDTACKSADAFEGSYKIVGGAGGIGMGIMSSSSAVPALPSAALLYVATEGAGGLIGLEGTLGQITPAESEIVQNGIDSVKETMQNTVLKAPLSGTSGDLFDIAAGAHSLRQAVISALPYGDGKSYRLLVSSNGPGNVEITPDMPFYAPDSVVSLKAIPEGNSDFRGWSGACSGQGTCTIIMTSNKTVAANFRQGRISGINYERHE